jgi:hypothetical protein
MIHLCITSFPHYLIAPLPFQAARKVGFEFLDGLPQPTLQVGV